MWKTCQIWTAPVNLMKSLLQKRPMFHERHGNMVGGATLFCIAQIMAGVCYCVAWCNPSCPCTSTALLRKARWPLVTVILGTAIFVARNAKSPEPEPSVSGRTTEQALGHGPLQNASNRRCSWSSARILVHTNVGA